jgi:hypothetical protein
MVNEYRDIMRIFKYLAEVSGVKFFEYVYKEPNGVNIVDIFKVDYFLSRLVTNEDKKMMYQEVSQDELFIVLSSF